MNPLKEILFQNNKDIDNQKLMDYLGNNLSHEERHEIEKQMINSEMVNDAIEGLEDFKNKKELLALAEQLNENLHRQLSLKKKRKDRRKLKDQLWVYLAIVLVLAITILFFALINKHLNAEKKKPAYLIENNSKR